MKAQPANPVRGKEFLWDLSPGDEQAPPAGCVCWGSSGMLKLHFQPAGLGQGCPQLRGVKPEPEILRLWQCSGCARSVSGSRMSSSAPRTRLISKLHPWPPQPPVWSLSVICRRNAWPEGAFPWCVSPGPESVPPASHDKHEVRRGWSSTPGSW